VFGLVSTVGSGRYFDLLTLPVTFGCSGGVVCLFWAGRWILALVDNYLSTDAGYILNGFVDDGGERLAAFVL
jgi:hypothetical protein